MPLVAGLLVLMVAAGCAGDADAGVEIECAADDLSCGLLTAEDLADGFGDTVTVSPAGGALAASTGRWCERPAPDPTARADAVFGVEAEVDDIAVSVAVTTSVVAFDGADAELTMEAVEGLHQGCSWDESGATFRYLDELDVAGFGDETLGRLIRVESGDAEDNAELLLLRRGDLVSQVALYPAQDSPALWDTLLRRMDTRLAATPAPSEG